MFSKINLLASLTILFFLTQGCFGSITPPINNFKLESFSYEEIPEYISDQISGAGCSFDLASNNGKTVMSNGLIKINGIYEILSDESSNGDFYNSNRYENERWILIVEMNEAGDETGILKLRSKNQDGEYQIKINRFCGT
jgi:hypothetical protein